MIPTRAQSGLAGLEAALTGRLASMSHDEAQRRILAAGGAFVATPRESTDLLFVGQAGAPLGDDGRLTRSLRVARDLRAAGGAIRIVPEEELLTLLGLADRRADLERLYTTAQLARILDVPQARIRAWVRQGLIEPVKVVRRLKFFDFRQVADAKNLSRLTESGVTPRRIKDSLAALEAWLPTPARALAQLQTLEQSGELVLRTEDGLVEASGQLRLDFDEPVEGVDGPPPALPGTPAFPTAPPRPVEEAEDEPAAELPEPDVPDAELWFQRGIRLEAGDRPEEAVLAYARALDPKRPRAEVAFNLGNVLYTLDRHEEAAQCFGLAVEIDREYVEAWNNLGNTCAALERWDEAIEAFERALALAPDYADAHFNLGETLAARGELEPARAHWEAYLAEDPHSSWAEEVRARLRRTE